jgi:DNA-binding winged helix-turn-helix (wHTH) protein
MSRSYEFGPFRLDVAEQVLLREGRAVPLPPKVYDVLRVLVAQAGHLVTKDETLRSVWPDHVGLARGEPLQPVVCPVT